MHSRFHIPDICCKFHLVDEIMKHFDCFLFQFQFKHQGYIFFFFFLLSFKQWIVLKWSPGELFDYSDKSQNWNGTQKGAYHHQGSTVIQILISIPLSRCPPKVDRVYSSLRPIVHPSLVKICVVVFVKFCWQTNHKRNRDRQKPNLREMK